MIAVGSLAALGLVGLWLTRARLLIVYVYGTSMRPTLAEGDRLLVRRTTVDRLKAGMIVVLAIPADPDPHAEPQLMVKRVAALPGDAVPAGVPVPDRIVPPGRLVALGDNPAQSSDSRAAGYFRASDVVGIVLRSFRRSTWG
jgi:signal peptidase I